MPNYLQINKEKELNEKRRANIDYINEHKANVIIAYKRFKTFISNSDCRITLSNEELKSLENDVMQHDNSKFSEIEFEAYRKHFYPCSFEKESEEDKVWEYYDSSRLKYILNQLEKEYIEQILDVIKSNEQYFMVMLKMILTKLKKNKSFITLLKVEL